MQVSDGGSLSWSVDSLTVGNGRMWDILYFRDKLIFFLSFVMIYPGDRLNIQLIFIIGGFHICEFTSKSIFVVLLWSFAAKILCQLIYMFPAEVKQGFTVPSCFRSHTIHKCHFCDFLMPLFCIFMLFIGDLAIKNTPHPQHSVEVLSSVWMLKKALQRKYIG